MSGLSRISGEKAGIAGTRPGKAVVAAAGCVAFVLAMALVGCSATPAPSHSPSALDYDQQYAADVIPVYNASDALSKARSNKQNITAFTQLSDVEHDTSARMLRQAWPAKAKADIQAYAEALSVESDDAAAMAGDFKIDPAAHSTGDAISYLPDASGLGNDSSNLINDSRKTNALSQRCLADLGISLGR